MKNLRGIPLILLVAAMCASSSAQPHPTYSTIEIEYFGKMDSPTFPIIISSSAEEADWYKRKLFSDVDLIGGNVYIVRDSIMRKIAEIPLLNGDMKSPNSSDGPRTSPGLRLVLATGHDSVEVTVEAAEGFSLLGEFEKQVSEYPTIVNEFSRMKRAFKPPQ